MNLRIFDDHEALSAAAARLILERQPGCVGLSGGETPGRLYELLSTQLPAKASWFLIDERFVPPDHPRSNSRMVEATLFRGAPPQGWLRFRTELGDPAVVARTFETEWQTFACNPADVVILGCGDDGHTASLFEGTSSLEVDDRVATEVFVPQQNEWRITVTKHVIRDAALRIVLASGESKRTVLQQVREGADLPIAQVTRGVETWWFVDRAATG